MGVKRFNLPDPGEGLTEATIVTWRVQPGDAITVNQVVVEIETSKSLVELPIPWDGTVVELLVEEGTEVEVGTPIIAVEVAGVDDDPAAGDPNAGTAPEASVAGLMAGAADDGVEEPGSEARVVDPSGGATGVQQFRLPDPGEGLTEATIVTWRVQPGDAITVNQVVVEIETSKSLVELPIPWDGTVVELLVEEGTEVAVGTPIIAVEVAGGAATGAEPAAGSREPNLVGYGEIAGSTTRRRRRGAAPAPAVSQAEAPAPPEPAPAPQPEPEPAPAQSAPVTRAGRPLAKPPVRKLAKDKGVDLAMVPGTGTDGIITRADVEAYLAGGADAAAAPEPAAATPPQVGSEPGRGERETRIPIKGVRKMTAQAMSASKFTAPHVTEFVTLDVTATMELVERLRTDREFRDVKVTPLLVVAKALLLACRRNPGVNATWDEANQEVVQKHYVNLGIAAATPRGLVVPNIKDADAMTMRELADAMSTLVDTARAGRTQPADMSGGTITITNVGVFGVDTGTPIINPGESAILAFGAVRRMPWVVTAPDGTESIVPRWVTQLGLSFDHRLIDGDLGSRFLADIAAVLEDPAKALVWG